ncbi:LysM peptidoglycan-binding domain-containing protein [Psychroserpens algicola]|uniref:LysM peptidoglycan-binding domain-containing protein n=1 Tax=Psychroserpens algicola TaxID=1719034 RepID=UPI001954333B|nr:LysM peptidoglycan-binding domain-containing protein [Psychroserpens algicola]
MQKNFRLIATVLVVTASSFGAVAQTETQKDVVLDGKPAKLNVKTGEVKLVELKTINGKIVESDTTKAKTVIQANLITNTSTRKKVDSTKAITTNRPDTLRQYYKKQLVSESETSTDSKNDSEVIDDVILITPDKTESAEKATTLVYDTTSNYSQNSATYEKSATNYHIVQKGETLYSLAKLYNTTLGQLKDANHLETTLIKVGQNLRVANFGTADARHSSVWTVSKGDTLYSIAKRNNTTVEAIKALNGLQSNLILPGQKLQLK